MKSKRLGAIDLDAGATTSFLDRLPDLPAQSCRAYSNNAWSKINLARRKGQSIEWLHASEAIAFPKSLIEDHFDARTIFNVMLFRMKRGAILIPHIDGPSPDHRFERVHIPLLTDAGSLHCEGGHVFHMRSGEVWSLDVAMPHCAACFSPTGRIHLTIDCEPGYGADLAKSLKPIEEPISQVRRPELGGGQWKSIRGLSHLISQKNFDRVLEFLSTLPFEFDLSCDFVFDLLSDICRDSGDADLLARAYRAREWSLNPFAHESAVAA